MAKRRNEAPRVWSWRDGRRRAKRPLVKEPVVVECPGEGLATTWTPTRAADPDAAALSETRVPLGEVLAAARALKTAFEADQRIALKVEMDVWNARLEASRGASAV